MEENISKIYKVCICLYTPECTPYFKERYFIKKDLADLYFEKLSKYRDNFLEVLNKLKEKEKELEKNGAKDEEISRECSLLYQGSNYEFTCNDSNVVIFEYNISKDINVIDSGEWCDISLNENL